MNIVADIHQRVLKCTFPEKTPGGSLEKRAKARELQFPLHHGLTEGQFH